MVFMERKIIPQKEKYFNRYVQFIGQIERTPEYEKCTYSEIIRRLVIRGLSIDEKTEKESA